MVFKYQLSAMAIAIAGIMLPSNIAVAAPPPPPVMEKHLKLTELQSSQQETADIFRRARMLTPSVFVPAELITGQGFDGRTSGGATVSLNVFPNGKISCTQMDAAGSPRKQRIFSKEICLLLSRHGKFLPALGRDGNRREGTIIVKANFHRVIQGRPVPGHCPPECPLPLSPYPGEYAQLKKPKQAKIKWLSADQYTTRFASANIWVTRKGKPKNCYIQRSSGTDIGDYKLCRYALKKMKFKPGLTQPPAAPKKAKKKDAFAKISFEMPWPSPSS